MVEVSDDRGAEVFPILGKRRQKRNDALDCIGFDGASSLACPAQEGVLNVMKIGHPILPFEPFEVALIRIEYDRATLR